MMAEHAFFEGTDQASTKQKEAYRRQLCEDWARAGYTEEKVLQAARTTNGHISDAFPDKHIGLVFVAGSKRFPTVDDFRAMHLPRYQQDGKPNRQGHDSDLWQKSGGQ